MPSCLFKRLIASEEFIIPEIISIKYFWWW